MGLYAHAPPRWWGSHPPLAHVSECSNAHNLHYGKMRMTAKLLLFLGFFRIDVNNRPLSDLCEAAGST